MEAYRKEAEIPSQECVYTSSNGAQQPHPYYAQRAGAGGGLLLQDYHLIGKWDLSLASSELRPRLQS